jgi:uncharacterized membrane protein YphA (DoxX/SURF4 family)
MEVKRTMSIVLWIIQALLALVFLLAGGMKLILPVAELTQQVPLPGVLIRVIGVIEVLGALGLILPGLFRIRIGLTYLAAAGLAVEMVVATVFALSVFGVTAVALPLVLEGGTAARLGSCRTHQARAFGARAQPLSERDPRITTINRKARQGSRRQVAMAPWARPPACSRGSSRRSA